MRLNQFALLVAGTAVFISGCTAGRSVSTPLSAGAETSRALSTGSEYDSDPPEGSVPGGLATQPKPLPPARGVSHFKSVSFLKAFGHKSPECAEDGCTDDKCAADECAADECPVAASSTCMVPGCAAPASECIADNDCGDVDCCEEPRRRFPRWLWKKHHQDDCAPESECVVPQEAECAPEKVCGEQACTTQRRGWKMFCPCPKPACVEETKCGESDCEPPVNAECCESEGCCTQNDQPRGLFVCLLDKFRHGVHGKDRGTCGDYCAAQEPDCGTEGCDDEGCGAESAANHCRPASPLADRLQDPFVNDGDSAPDVPPGAVPQTPAEDSTSAPKSAEPRDVQDAPPPPQPSNERRREVDPVAGTSAGQTIVEPRMWPRLRENRFANERSPYTTHPTGWHHN